MTMITTKPATSAACPPGALQGGLTRTRFFDGMFLTQADLENEQRYWRIKRRLTNRALGDGVVWGLRLNWNRDRHTFTLSPGYALDCCGNDLVVECPIEIPERQLWDFADPGLRAGVKADVFTTASSRELASRRIREACVVLQYVECAEDARPVHRDACAGPSGSCESSRIRETTRLLLVPPHRAPQKSPPEMFYDELIAFRDGLPSDVRTALFPPSNTPQPTPNPSTGDLPLTLVVTVPDSPDVSTGPIQPRLGETPQYTQISAVQNPPGDRRSGVVTFELRPHANWGFSAGTVRDANRVVDQAAPPLAMAMFWSLDVALPQSGSVPFAFYADVQLDQAFGGHQRAKSTFEISGILSLELGDNNAVRVSVNRLTTRVLTADFVESPTGATCFSELVPWGWTIDTAHGSTIARSLVLSALYVTLSEVTARQGSQAWQNVASLLYYAAWRALFGVDLMSQVDETYRKQLVAILVKMFERWCAALAYPGPRCTDEHHGVYLGCAKIADNGTIVSFDMWEGRRYVLTGPLITYWAGQFGIAPLDVIVGRLAEAVCCLAGQPVIGTGFTNIILRTTENAPASSTLALGSRLAVGDAASITDMAARRNLPLRWVRADELTMATMSLFTRASLDGASEVVAFQVAGGGAVGVTVPAGGTPSGGGTSPPSGGGASPPSGAGGTGTRFRSDVLTTLRSGANRVPARIREPLADVTVRIANAAPMAALVPADATAAVKELATRLDDRGIRMSTLLENGADRTLERAGVTVDDANRAAADTLVDRAELALDGTAAALARASRTGVGDNAFIERAATDVGKAFPGRLPADVVATATRATFTPR